MPLAHGVPVVFWEKLLHVFVLEYRNVLVTCDCVKGVWVSDVNIKLDTSSRFKKEERTRLFHLCYQL